VYEVSCLAYRGLAIDRRDQAILVTGESGAGKTETVKIVLQHLATLEQSRPGETVDTTTIATATATIEAVTPEETEAVTPEETEAVTPEETEAVTPETDLTATVTTPTGNGADTVMRVLESSPVFEAFGNAKTLRNDNSSRFGRFTQLQFKVESMAEAKAGGRAVPYCRLAGSTCVTYLLEKSRVVSHSPGERTYHIFYELLAAPPAFKENLWPWFADVSADDFTYIADSSKVEVQHDLEDSALWPRVLDALKLFSFQGEELFTLMRALGIILQLGNLTFDHDPTSDIQEGSTIISSTKELELLSDMIGIDADELESALTLRIIKTAYEEVQVQLRPSVAKESCDALAKEIYSRVFDVLVRRINEYTGAPDHDAIKYGIVSFLDIFGFERFQVNRFEQLCINYANESMQFKYVLDNFRQIKEDYIDEGIEIFNFSVVDNSNVLQLLEGRIGLIVALNEECIRPNGNDESFVYKIKIVHKEDPRLVDEKLHLKTEFGIRHFAGKSHSRTMLCGQCKGQLLTMFDQHMMIIAGPVKYDATKFVERNTDKLPDGLLYCAVKTSNTLIRQEFQTLIEIHESNTSAEVVRKKKTHRTVLEKFRSQLKDLMNALEGTKTRYIRCIKPNEVMAPKLTDHFHTMRQLECAGLVTAILFSRESYPTKLGYDALLERFSPLMNAPSHRKNLGELTHRKDKANYMLATLLASMVEESSTFPFACGKTRVYFKAGAMELLETQRQEYYSGKATILQRWIRAKQGEARFKMVRRAFILAQAHSRSHLERNRFLRKKKAATVVEAWVRGTKAARSYQAMRRENAATKIQSRWRGRTKKREWDRVRQAVGVLQQAARNRHNRENFTAKLLVCVEEARMDKKLLELKSLVANKGAGLPKAGTSRQVEESALGDVEKYVAVEELQFSCFASVVLTKFFLPFSISHLLECLTTYATNFLRCVGRMRISGPDFAMPKTRSESYWHTHKVPRLRRRRHGYIWLS
jgi:myosin-5